MSVMRYRKKSIVILLIFVILSILFLENYQVIFIKKNKISNGVTKMGIIDGKLSREHSNISKYQGEYSSEQNSHGDKILNFMKNYCPNCSFYYYDAEENGIISSKKLLSGLQWMVDNEVEYVSISLSSKYYSNEIEKWIKENVDKITVYASYSNALNSLDYPATYDSVIGVGSSVKIKKKKHDIIFDSSRIILLDYLPGFYEGNSFLSPYSMVQDNIL